MKLKPILIFLCIATIVLILQQFIQNNRDAIHKSLGERIRALSPTQQDYRDKCSNVSLPIEPKVDKNSGKLLDSFNNSRSQKDRQYLKDVLQDNDPNLVDYIVAIIPFLAPFIILFVLSLIGYWFYCGCVCCDCYVSCCSCCRRNPAKKPYTNCQICWPLICFLVFGGFCIAVCIFGVVATFNFVEAVEQSGCAVSLIFKDIVYGSDQDSIKWSGTSGVVKILTDIQGGISGFGTSVNDAFRNTATIQAAVSTISSDIDTVDAGFDSDAQIKVVSPTTGLANTFEIPFFQKVGPKTQSDTLTAQLQGYVSAFSDFGTLSTNSKKVQTEVTNIKNAMNNAISPVQDINREINSFGEQATDGIDTIQPYLSNIRLAFIIIFSLLMALIVASIVGVLLAKLCQMSCCKFLIHLGWCCTSWMMILSLLLGGILFTVGIVMDDSCFSLDDIITPEDLNKVSQIKSVSQYVQSCLNTGQNDFPSMASSLNVKQQLDQIDDVDKALKQFRKTNNGSVNTSQLDTAISNIANLKTHPNLVMLQSSDQNAGIDTNNSWETITTSLNNDIKAACNNQDDFFVSNNDQCSLAAGGQRCINVVTFTTGTNYIACTGFDQTRISKLKATLDEISTELGNLQTNVTTLKNTFNSELSNLNNFFNIQFDTFEQSINSIINDVSNTDTGLIAQLDCKWIGLRWQSFDKAFCDSMVPNFSIIGIALLLSAVFNVFVVCCGGCLAIRISADFKYSKVKDSHNNSGLRNSTKA